MKRIAIKIFLFLLLGAVTSVAVAWGCALVAPIRPLTSPVERVSGAEDWIGYLFMEPGGVQIRSLPDDELSRLRFEHHSQSVQRALLMFVVSRDMANAASGGVVA